MDKAHETRRICHSHIYRTEKVPDEAALMILAETFEEQGCHLYAELISRRGVVYEGKLNGLDRLVLECHLDLITKR